MDYSVGSLSDLITGSNTPNKPKVVRKQITILEKKSGLNKSLKLQDAEITTTQVPSLKKKKVKKVKMSIRTEASPEKPTKKRKSEIIEEEESVPKRSKNDENAERRINFKEKTKKPEESPEVLSRTVFVGNLPITSNTKKFKRFFMKYGKVEAVRIRGVPVANPKTPKKVAVIKKEFHPDRNSFYGFVRFETREDAIKSTEANGLVYQDHHLRVHLCDVKDKPDESKAIFVGNLSFHAEEDDLWKLFESCGPISCVRIVRDGRTGMGKGFGYVNFENSDSVPLALEMENVQLNDRELRISISNITAAKKKRKINKPRKIKGFKKSVKGDSKEVTNQENDQVKIKNKSFQGAKFVDKKKKNKLNKGVLQKKKMMKKVAPK